MTFKSTLVTWLLLMAQARKAQELCDQGRYQDARNIMINSNLKGCV
jgi:hypothetical protein